MCIWATDICRECNSSAYSGTAVAKCCSEKVHYTDSAVTMQRRDVNHD